MSVSREWPVALEEVTSLFEDPEACASLGTLESLQVLVEFARTARKAVRICALVPAWKLLASVGMAEAPA